MFNRFLRKFSHVVLAVSASVWLGSAPAVAQAPARPNILVIWGDDIGQFNISAYNMGMMGYRTPNLDRIAREGALFTDWYAVRAARQVGPRSSPASRPSAPV